MPQVASKASKPKQASPAQKPAQPKPVQEEKPKHSAITTLKQNAEKQEVKNIEIPFAEEDKQEKMDF